jgi:hypothetical protein
MRGMISYGSKSRHFNKRHLISSLSLTSRVSDLLLEFERIDAAVLRNIEWDASRPCFDLGEQIKTTDIVGRLGGCDSFGERLRCVGDASGLRAGREAGETDID